MNYTKLAELLYPNITKTIDDYLKIYPKRNLKEGAEVTRFAPSPTGYLHLGHFSGALTDLMLARSTDGVFYFRLEDTDGKRTVDDATQVAMKTLKAFDIPHDEGLTLDGEKGDYGPYKQSERIEIYHTFAKKLVEIGRAYPCFCAARENKEEILEERKSQLENLNTIETKDPCRNLSFEEVKAKIDAGEPWALRFKSMGKEGETFNYTDVAKGERTMPKNTTDYVIVKSNGVPVYHLAHVTDDTLMHTTTVVRGNEWLGTLPLHVEMFEALGLTPPKYLHTCLIMKKDEKTGNLRKISKRYDPEADMRFYLKSGYPVEAVKRYVMNLINSGYEAWALENPDASLDEYVFDKTNLTTSNPMFDIMKLNDISKTVISKLTTDEVFSATLNWAKDYNEKDYEMLKKYEPLYKAVLSIDRGGIRARKDIVKFEDVVQIYDYILPNFKVKIDDEFKNLIANLKIDDLKEFLRDYMENYSESEDNSAWFNDIKNYALKHNFADNKDYKLNPKKYAGKVGDAVQVVRFAITSRLASPELYSIMKAIGKDECKKRINNLLKEEL